jgi:hypothetical protein
MMMQGKLLLSLLFLHLPPSFGFQSKLLSPKKNRYHSTSAHASANKDTGNFPADKYEDFEYDSLDVVLERARQRRPSFFTKVMGKLTQPIVPALPWVSGIDFFYITVALVLDAKGFSLGYGIGKATNYYLAKTVSSSQGKLIRWWPVILAIGMDQII